METSAQDSVEIPPLVTELRRWRRVPCGFRRTTFQGSVQLMDDEGEGYVVTPDVDHHELLLFPFGPEPDFKVRYRNDAPERYEFEGVFEGKALRMGLVRRPTPAFPLATTGFHWISEAPFIR